MKQLMTLSIITQDSRILLGMKKRGFGAGRWNGFGGKVESYESVEAAATRELVEEVGIRPVIFEKVGVIDFNFSEVNNKPIEMHVFLVTEYTGEPIESDEMEPDWFDYAEIPYQQMWVDDAEWLPFVLTGQKFLANFTLDKPATNDYASQIIDFSVDAVSEFPSEQGLR